MHASNTVSRSVTWVAIATGLILLVPAVAMQFSDEVRWGPLDFVLMGALLFGAGLAFVLIARRVDHVAYRLAVGLAVAAGLLLIWVNLAAGLIGAEDHPANLMYGVVLLTAGVGAVLARFEARGLAIAMFATAGAIALVAVIALLGNLGAPENSRLELAAANGVFFALFLVSGLLFQHAARKSTD
jgi:hypothetical protein